MCEDVVGFPVSGRPSSSWFHNDLTAEPWWPLCVNLFKKEKRMLYRQKRKEEEPLGVEGKAEEKEKRGEEEKEERTQAGADGYFLKELQTV